MANGVNKTILLGNLGADPELKMSSSGTAILRLRLATSEPKKERDGSWSEHTEWHSITCFGKRAEGLGKFLSKGSKLYVEGRLRTSSYDDKEGNKRYRTEIIADEIVVCDKRGGGGGERQQSAPAASSEYAADDYDDGSEEPLPF